MTVLYDSKTLGGALVKASAGLWWYSGACFPISYEVMTWLDPSKLEDGVSAHGFVRLERESDQHLVLSVWRGEIGAPKVEGSGFDPSLTWHTDVPSGLQDWGASPVTEWESFAERPRPSFYPFTLLKPCELCDPIPAVQAFELWEHRRKAALAA